VSASLAPFYGCLIGGFDTVDLIGAERCSRRIG
jgi:hypothetical protein